MTKIHCLSGTKEYKLWKNIKSRCFNKNTYQYNFYGARGITMYEDWINDPVSFINYIKSLENYGIENYSLDRIDNNNDYKPDNLRWATQHIQKCNQRIYKNNTSGYKGIIKHKKNNKWISRININNERFILGYYDNIEEAIIVRDKYIIENNLKEYILNGK